MLALKRVLSAVLFVLLLPVLSQAQSIGYANLEDVGFSRQGLNRISETRPCAACRCRSPGRSWKASPAYGQASE